MFLVQESKYTLNITDAYRKIHANQRMCYITFTHVKQNSTMVMINMSVRKEEALQEQPPTENSYKTLSSNTSLSFSPQTATRKPKLYGSIL